MMHVSQLFLLISITFCFFVTGGIIDYWQASMEHKKKRPRWLTDYFLVIWLFLYTGLFPILFVFVASDFNIRLTGICVGAFSIGSVLWDITYSYLDTGRFISHQLGYFVLKQKNYSLTDNQILFWHIFRTILGMVIILVLL